MERASPNPSLSPAEVERRLALAEEAVPLLEAIESRAKPPGNMTFDGWIRSQAALILARYRGEA